MKPKIESIQQFIKSLNPQQRAYFVGREADHQKQLEACTRDLGRGLSQVSALYGDAVAITLSASESHSQPSIASKHNKKTIAN